MFKLGDVVVVVIVKDIHSFDNIQVSWRMLSLLLLLLFRKTIFKLEDVVVVIVQEVNIQGGEEDLW